MHLAFVSVVGTSGLRLLAYSSDARTSNRRLFTLFESWLTIWEYTLECKFCFIGTSQGEYEFRESNTIKVIKHTNFEDPKYILSLDWWICNLWKVSESARNCCIPCMPSREVQAGWWKLNNYQTNRCSNKYQKIFTINYLPFFIKRCPNFTPRSRVIWL